MRLRFRMNGCSHRCVSALVLSTGVLVLVEAAGIAEQAAALFGTARAADLQRSTKTYRIGFVSPTGPGARNDAFLQGLRELGYVDGHNVRVEMRFAEGRPERIAGLVDELISLKVDVLVVGATVGARAARNATTSIPVIFAGSSDPIAGGIVSNLARPEGNITGTSLAIGERFAGKWLELLKEVTPRISHVAVLWSSSNAAATRFLDELHIAARKLDVTIDVHHAAHAAELEQALVTLGNSKAQGLIVTPSPFAAANQDRLVGFAASKRLPAIYFADDFPLGGGLMSYGPSIAEAYGRAAGYVSQILRNGARPADLPVTQPERFELVVNLRTARALGLDVPHSVLLRARVID
jgi:putative ABC transport system substrate-binding protein